MYTIPFETLTKTSPFAFQPVAFSNFPAVKKREQFGSMTVDIQAFTTIVVQHLAAVVDGQEIVKAVLYCRLGEGAHRAIVFLASRKTLGIELTGDENFQSWLEQIVGLYGGTSAEISFSGNTLMAGRLLDGTLERLLTAPATLAISSAPDSYKKRKLDQEKIDCLGLSLVKPAVSYDQDRFAKALGGFLDRRGVKPKRSATARVLKAIEKQLGAPLPGDFHALFAKINGSPGLFYGRDLLTLEAVQAQHNDWAWIFDDWRLEDLQENKSAESGVRALYCCPRWVPFIDLEGGHYLAIDTAPEGDAPYGQVIVFGRDIEHNRRIASSLTEFLEACIGYDESAEHPLYSVFGTVQR